MRVVIPEGELIFEHPLRILRAHTAEQVEPALRAAQDACDAGLYCAGYLSYELGAVLASQPPRADRTLPLLALGIYAEPQRGPLPRASGSYRMSGARPRISRASYDQAVRSIARAIYDGDVYQVNYTVPFDFAFSGDPYALFCDLLARCAVTHAAYAEDRGLALVSLSPELFLELGSGWVMTKPMKGTAAPHHAERLEDSKNRAEHLMIVDLLRNDLHRICSQVAVPRLYSIERYPTFWTMTSTLRGHLRSSLTLKDILDATFPCGSITGAPKLAAMRIIQTVEPDARGAYTGTIGYQSPQGKGNWNVAIRTLQIDRTTSRGRLDVGGGIVADSNAADEWHEIAIKKRFVQTCTTDFALLETFAANAAPERIAAHLARLERSASHFAIPLRLDAVWAAITLALGKASNLVRLRLGWDGTPVVRLQERGADGPPVQVCIARRMVRSDDPLLAHKTSWRGAFDRAHAGAVRLRCFDAIGTNERDELTEGTRTSLFVELGGALYTPPLRSGVLPGVLRGALLEQGRCTERVLYEPDLQRASAIYVGNSARGLLRAELTKELSGVS